MKEKGGRSDMTSYSLRLVAGLYLLYLDYSLIKEWNNGNANRIIIAAATILFAVVGILLVVHSARNMIRLNKNPQIAQADEETDNIEKENIEEISKNEESN